METDTQEIFVEGIKRLLSDINKERKKIGRKKLTIDEICLPHARGGVSESAARG